jgi:hypothetical protein
LVDHVTAVGGANLAARGSRNLDTRHPRYSFS